MRLICAVTFLTGLMAMPASARAADWWLVKGEPGGRDAYFIDTDTIARDGAATWFHMLHINAARGPDPSRMEQVRCGQAEWGDGDLDAIYRFVCATPEERMSLGAMLGSLTPELTAQTIFQMPQPKVAQR
jgi:hypothetical protein